MAQIQEQRDLGHNHDSTQNLVVEAVVPCKNTWRALKVLSDHVTQAKSFQKKLVSSASFGQMTAMNEKIERLTVAVLLFAYRDPEMHYMSNVLRVSRMNANV